MRDASQLVIEYARAFPNSPLGTVVANGGVDAAVALITKWPGRFVKIPSRSVLTSFYFRTVAWQAMKDTKTYEARCRIAKDVARYYGIRADYVVRKFREAKRLQRAKP